MSQARSVFLNNFQRLAATLRDPIPAWNPDTIAHAEHAVIGEICPQADGSYTRLDLAAVDWTCAQAGNPAVVQMHLLRFLMLPPLAAGFAATGEERFAQAARRYIEAFLRDHPITADWRPASYDGPTQYDLRIGCTQNPGWLGTLGIFLGSAAFDDAFFATIIAAVRAHVAYLAEHVYPDRNIRLLHGEVLLCAGLWLSFLPEAQQWLEAGVLIVNDAVGRQILPDGAHAEAVPCYHNVTLHMFTNLWRIAQAMPQIGLQIPTERIAAMYDYALACTRPDGAESSLHDSIYAPAAAPYNDCAARGRDDFRREAALPALPLPQAIHYEDAGQVFVRDGWSPAATYLTFDATTRRSWHWHPSRNGITLYANGRALLVDPGYVFSTPQWPTYGDRTAQHSTVNLNGWDQSHALAQVRLRQTAGYDLIEGSYQGGYWPKAGHSHGAGIFGEHRRTLLWIRGRCLVVLDHIHCTSEAGRKPTVECIWQLSEGQAMLEAADRVHTLHDDSNLLLLLPVMPQGTKVTLHRGERDPMRGWLPSEWGRRCIEAPMVRLSAADYDPWSAHYATVLVPYTGKEAPMVKARGVGPAIGLGGSPAGRLEIHWPDGSEDRLVWTAGLATAIEDQHELTSDGGLVHVQLAADGRPVRGLVVDGSVAAYRGKAVAGVKVMGSR